MTQYKGNYTIHAEVEARQLVTLSHEEQLVKYGEIEEIISNSATHVIDETTGNIIASIDGEVDDETLYEELDRAIREHEKQDVAETISVRTNFKCISMKDVGDAESFHEDVDFAKGVAGAIEAFNKLMTKDPTNPYDVPSADWFTNIYYTNEDDGYYFYTQEDLDAAHEGEK